MGKLHDLKRQLQEAWDKKAYWESATRKAEDAHSNTVKQLHRVARERDEERGLRQTWERRSKEAWALNKILNEHIAAEA
jgi:hypothetical protein